jgi:hypothetical protein
MSASAITALQDQQAALLGALFTHPAQGEARRASECLLLQLTKPGKQTQRGLQAYQANGHSLAERSLAAAYPVIEQMLGHHNFAALARDLWHQHPPARGDLAHWGDALPDFLTRNEALADVPYLADVARVEWALHRAASATDAVADHASFGRLAEPDTTGLTLALAPGTALISSPFPVASLVLSHRRAQPSLAQAADRLRSAVAESALVWRQGLRPRMAQIPAVEAALLRALLQALDLPTALNAALTDEADETQAFDFSLWLTNAVTTGLVLGVQSAAPSHPSVNP